MIEMRRLHPAAMITRWLKMLPQLAGGGAAYAVAVDGAGRLILLGALVAAIGIAAALVGWWRLRYGVGDGEIVIESGLVHRQRRVIPFDRVQDIAIERRPIARLFGAARVKIETGGSAADEGTLDMVSLADASALRDRVRGHGKSAAGPAEPLLFAIGLGRLFLSGLFNFSLLFLAILAAIFQNLYEFGLVDPAELVTPERADAAAELVDLRITLVVIAVLLLLGLVSGVIRTAARDYGFRLTRTEAGLRRRRGLLTLSEIVIPVHRVETAQIAAGPITAALGWYRLSFQTLGADRKERGLQVVAPFARREEIGRILASVGFPEPPPRAEFRRSPPRALVRRAGQYLLAALAALALAFLAEPLAGLGAGAMLLIALLAWGRWRRRGFALGEDSLFVSAGSLSPRLSIIPLRKTQAIELSVGPVQRRLRLATLLVDTAGAPLVGPPAMVDLDRGEAERLGDQLLDIFSRARTRAKALAASDRPGIEPAAVPA